MKFTVTVPPPPDLVFEVDTATAAIELTPASRERCLQHVRGELRRAVENLGTPEAKIAPVPRLGDVLMERLRSPDEPLPPPDLVKTSYPDLGWRPPPPPPRYLPVNADDPRR